MPDAPALVPWGQLVREAFHDVLKTAETPEEIDRDLPDAIRRRFRDHGYAVHDAARCVRVPDPPSGRPMTEGEGIATGVIEPRKEEKPRTEEGMHGIDWDRDRPHPYRPEFLENRRATDPCCSVCGMSRLTPLHITFGGLEDEEAKEAAIERT